MVRGVEKQEGKKRQLIKSYKVGYSCWQLGFKPTWELWRIWRILIQLSHTVGKEERYYFPREIYSWGHEVLDTWRLAVVGLRERPGELQEMLWTNWNHECQGIGDKHWCLLVLVSSHFIDEEPEVQQDKSKSLNWLNHNTTPASF